MKSLIVLLFFLMSSTAFAQFDIPTPIRLGPPIYRELINCGNIETRQDVFMTIQGRPIQVPIINGWVPTAKVHVYPDGSERQIFDYKKRIKYSSMLNKAKNVKKKSKVVEPIPTMPYESSLRKPSDVLEADTPAKPVFEPSTSPFLR